MSFLFLLVVSAFASAIMLWGLTVFIQGYFYNAKADKLPLRAAAGGMALGMFLSLWTFVNVKADIPNKYGTLLEFQTVAETPVQQFKAVRYFASSKEEQTVTYLRLPPGGKFVFAEAKPDATPDIAKPYQLNDSQSMTIAILLVEPGKPDTRFETELVDDPRTGKTYKRENKNEEPQKIFSEKGGKRYLHGDNPDKVSAPSRGSAFGAVALNVLSFAVWFAVFWLALRYTALHSVGLAFVAGMITMVVLMPLLFQKFAK